MTRTPVTIAAGRRELELSELELEELELEELELLRGK